MQTFVPFPSFAESAACLDRQRLGKQRVEVIQLVKALRGQSKGWGNHPAAKMWRGHELSLIDYGIVVCDEWVRRGYKDGCADQLAKHYGELLTEWWNDQAAIRRMQSVPNWWGDQVVHRSHQSRLLQKDRAHYQEAFGFTDAVVEALIESQPEYVWPVP